MARFPVANAVTVNNPLTPIVDTQGKLQGILIQNVSAVDVFISDDPTTLQAILSGAAPNVGLHLPPDSVGITPFILVIPYFRGKLYARAQGAGAAVEVIKYDICATPVEAIPALAAAA